MPRHRYTGSFISRERSRIVFAEFVPGFELIVGKVNQIKAEEPIEKHTHSDSFEIVYIVKGEQIYHIGNREYQVKSGECFITLPDEQHSSGGYPEDKSLLYYVIVSYNLLNRLGFDEVEARQFKELLLNPVHRVFQGTGEMVQILEALVTMPPKDILLAKTRMKQNITQFLLLVVECMDKKSGTVAGTLGPIQEYIQAHITENISIKELAQLMNLSESRFKAYFRVAVGIPPGEYILRQKIHMSKKLLRTSSKSITEIAFALSFSSSQYFATVFKRFTTLSPIEYRLQNAEIKKY